LKFIENTGSDGFVTREAFRLTDNAKNELFSELNLLEHQIKRKKGLLLCESISVKKMFYNNREQENIEKLKDLLLDENLKKVQDRLSENGMRKGFACLFSGSPGTGKTETVYQLAKETNRNVMVVDISAIKDMYVGETEKKIMEIFSNYKAAVSASDRIPILLFNEADAIIGKRIEFGNDSRAVDRMENTMQNIILQELENLTGILIATTNLTQNMDKAFERRFLYKIEFEKPNITNRQAIWRSMLPNLSEQESFELASLYDFSGGQIENIARKRTVDFILSGNNPSFDKMRSYCHEETLDKNSISRIGFAV
jgi:SpoVK/Ycf46/Vps4 family AAA+-type ATPase